MVIALQFENDLFKILASSCLTVNSLRLGSPFLFICPQIACPTESSGLLFPQAIFLSSGQDCLSLESSYTIQISHSICFVLLNMAHLHMQLSLCFPFIILSCEESD